MWNNRFIIWIQFFVNLICFRSSGKMNQGKAPRRVHKAEREKMKREHLNELFLDLANTLGNPLYHYFVA